MAFPTIPTGGRVLTTNQTDSSGTRTFPSLSSLTKNSGDLLIAIIVAYQSSVTNSAFSSWGGGFTEFVDSGTSTTMAIGAAYKWSTGSETGTFTVTQAATITGDASMVLLSIPGAHLTTPPEGGSRADGTGSAADPASFNPGGWDAEDTLWISVVGSGMTSGTGSWTATGTTAPSNYTDRVDTNASDTSTIGDVEAAVAFRQLNAASEDVGTAGVDTSNARNAAIVIAVRPAPALLQGSASGSITWAGAATGTTVRSGASTGSITWAGAATGSAPHNGSASGSITWAGSADGEAPVPPNEGSASGSISWSGAAAGVSVYQGASTGSISWVGTADGTTTHQGAASGSITWAGAADGTTLRSGAGSGSISWTGTADGASAHQGSASGSVTWTGSATGPITEPEPPTGLAIVGLQMAGIR